MSVAERFVTHSVDNQAPPLGRYNAYATDTALREAVHREGGGWAEAHLNEFGIVSGGELMELGYTANENKPKLKTFDRYGHRIDEVEFHPAYHRVMQLGMQYGVHAYACATPTRLAPRWRELRCPTCTTRLSRAPAAR